MSRTGRLLTVPALAAVLVAPWALPAAAADQDDDLARLEATEITPAMLADAVVELDPADAVFTLTTTVIGLERTQEQAGTSVVTLTSDLLFDFGESELTPASAAALAELAQTITPGAAVAVDGHTDSVSGDDVNVPLSQARAQAVADVLAATRPDLVLTVTGHGSAVPVAPNTAEGADNPAGRAQNRRVELTYATA
ncbi:OmpA family protein [Cellulomonas chengniuliangii]|uniref:OmpA family protein n=1 Tax=Cellulomonas chengniuliangii TaxID=2968084 RepID=UPI001D0DCD85|nr:OmpA family protein [Cellulomonas chengniuliangii]MCC2318645.1 OmpA family protein [Cellulomonas chengniuliangii]